MPKFLRPCLKCGEISRGGTYCPAHLAEVQAAREKKRTNDPVRQAKKKLLYNSDYRKRRAAILEHVYQFGADCHLCREPIKLNQKIDIDHLFPGDPSSPLLPTHATCNRSRGNRTH